MRTSVFQFFPVINLYNGFILRQPHLKDASGYFENYNKPEISRFVPDECIPRDILEARRSLEYLKTLFNSRENVSWVIAKEDTDEFVGTIGFHNLDSFHRRNEIAYELAPEYWGYGIMSAAMRAVLKFAFNSMGLARVEATTVTYNNRSINLLLKCGFTLEGILSAYKYYKGKHVDIVILGQSVYQYQNNQQQYINSKTQYQARAEIPSYTSNVNSLMNYHTNSKSGISSKKSKAA